MLLRRLIALTVVLSASLLALHVIPNPAWKPLGGEDPVLRIVGLLAAGTLLVQDTSQLSTLFNHALVYDKGASVLHMLRHELGNDLYRRCIKTYLDRHQYGSVVTETGAERREALPAASKAAT